MRDKTKTIGNRRGLLRAFRRDERGSAAVEFGLGIMSLLLVMLAVLEFGRMLWISNSLQYIAESTVRFAVVNETASESQLTDYARANMPGMQSDEISVEMTQTTSGDVNMVQITVSHSFSPMMGLLPIGSHTLRGRAQTATY